MKTFPLILNLLIFFGGFSIGNSQNLELKTDKTQQEHLLTTVDKAKEFGQLINEESLKSLVYTLASDDFEGRLTGDRGQKLAANFLREFYIEHQIESAVADSSYFQNIPKEYFRGTSENDSENVIAIIKGSDKADEFIIISAHYDHVGIKDGKVYNGADDDASGTSAVLEIARAFKQAVDAGYRPRRTVIFLHVTGEERGLFGSKYYTENPLFSLDNTVVNLNIDMIGRVDKHHQDDQEFIYLIGADKLSFELHELSERVNKEYTQLSLDYTYNDINDPNRFYYRSDHYNFARNNIPIIFYFNGVHSDYHKPSDTADKIRYDLLKKRTQLIFYTAWEIANKDERLKLDKK